VAVLVPTTVLAEQHLNTFRERLSAYPVRIEALSRFRNRKEQTKIVNEIAAGAVDIVIGTHRLLSGDVKFREMGLLIVDEEQRFGVSHKEKLKQLRKTVDVLTLTATPIPRTLHMSLAGIRDMSVINDPPQGRIPIKTSCDEYSDETVRGAILRELERDGQVYYVHNRVAEISHVAERVKRLAPHARVGVGHGQMLESALEKVMMAFYHRQYDILVCTTIIESGLDIPNVNTIIIDDAERYGLATLYQLRGRVGRSDRQAYAYFLHRQGLVLKDTAWKRIEAIREFSDLGSGFKVALRDLEIRGAGNLLGAEQHGFMVSVGFDLYCQMLAEAVRELKGEEAVERPLPEISLPVDAYLPKDYVEDDAERIILYKKIAGSATLESLAAVAEELADRFGRLPRQAANLFEVARLRIRARDARVKRVGLDRTSILIDLERGSHLAEPEVAFLNQRIPGALAMPNQVKLPRDHRDPLKKVEVLVREFLSRRRTLVS
jgi:transcription-repair coupling factor (superfamily II helicase)